MLVSEFSESPRERVEARERGLVSESEDWSKGMSSRGEVTLEELIPWSVWLVAGTDGIVTSAGRSRTGAERVTGNGGGGNSSNGGGSEVGGISA